jgi:hypothetical protein
VVDETEGSDSPVVLVDGFESPALRGLFTAADAEHGRRCCEVVFDRGA